MPQPSPREQTLEAELAALRAELQGLLATVSHDLRAPLRHISAYVQLVQEDAAPQLSPEVQGFLNTISDSAQHLGQMLDGLTGLARVGASAVQLEPVALQPLLHTLADALSAQHPGRTLVWQIAPDLPAVQADAALLRQALGALLDNAVKFSAGIDPAQIAISASQRDGMVQLQVRDNGVGFKPTQAHQLFQVFSRLHSPRQFPGLGLGLALARKVAERLGGQISAQAELNAGCCISLRLPGA